MGFLFHKAPERDSNNLLLLRSNISLFLLKVSKKEENNLLKLFKLSEEYYCSNFRKKILDEEFKVWIKKGFQKHFNFFLMNLGNIKGYPHANLVKDELDIEKALMSAVRLRTIYESVQCKQRLRGVGQPWKRVMTHVFENMDRICTPDYQPTFEDYLVLPKLKNMIGFPLKCRDRLFYSAFRTIKSPTTRLNSRQRSIFLLTLSMDTWATSLLGYKAFVRRINWEKVNFIIVIISKEARTDEFVEEKMKEVVVWCKGNENRISLRYADLNDSTTLHDSFKDFEDILQEFLISKGMLY